MKNTCMNSISSCLTSCFAFFTCQEKPKNLELKNGYNSFDSDKTETSTTTDDADEFQIQQNKVNYFQKLVLWNKLFHAIEKSYSELYDPSHEQINDLLARLKQLGTIIDPKVDNLSIELKIKHFGFDNIESLTKWIQDVVQGQKLPIDKYENLFETINSKLNSVSPARYHHAASATPVITTEFSFRGSPLKRPS